MFREYSFKRYDFFLVLLVVALVILGIFAIKSATYSSVDGTFVQKQIIGFIIGFFLMSLVSVFNYNFIAKFYWVFYILNIALLVAVLLFGKNVNNATRWISIGGINLQASELCKTFLTIFFAQFISKYRSKINKPWFLLVIVILTMIPVFLILKEPNLSTSLVIVFMVVMMVFAGGISYKYVVGAIIVLVPVLALSFWYIQQPDQKLLEPYQVTRIMTLVYPEQADASSRMQTENSVKAIGSGQLSGKGLYQGKLNKYNYLPEPQTDFIFSIVGEETGFIGCSVILSLMLMLLLRCLWIAKDAKDLTALLMVTGFVAVIGSHTFVNVGVVTGIMPNTGVPLPFISYGLSSLLSNMISLGLILNISMQRKSQY